MKLKQFFATVCLILCGSCGISAQSYQQLWKEVETLELKDLPQSVIKKAQSIYHKAEQEKNAPQMMKAFLTAMVQRNQLGPDSFYVDIKVLENWVTSPKISISDAAVLHSLLGNIYYKAASRGSFKQDLVTELPKDMSEWSRLMYQQKAYDHYAASIENLESLDSLKSNDYLPIVNTGKWSKYYDHSLMFLIGRRSMQGMLELKNELESFYAQSDWNFPYASDDFMRYIFLPASSYDCPTSIMQTCYRLLAFYKITNQREAWLLTELYRIKTDSQYNNDSYNQALLKLQKDFADLPICAEVYKELGAIYAYNSKKSEQLRLIREAIAKYPRYARINELKNIEQEILQPELYASFSSNLYPGQNMNLKINHRNLSAFTLRFYKINQPADSITGVHQWDTKWLSKYATIVSRQEFALQPNTEYQSTDTVFTIKTPASGIYLMETIAKGKTSSRSLFYVTPLRLLRLNLPGDSLQMVVLDGMNGHPVPQATIYIGSYAKGGNIQLKKKLTTNSQGTITTKADSKWSYYRAATARENSMLFEQSGYNNPVNRQTEKEEVHTNLFTDRILYRPGQTIYVKGIIYKQLGEQLNVLPDKKYTLSLEDTNNKEISQIQVKTNKYGSFTANFILPTSCLTGHFSILLNKGDKGRVGIQVEEYKRPTFEVKFTPVTKPYAVGDSVTLEGEALTYSGVPLAQAKVTYKISKKTENSFFRWGNLLYNNKQIESNVIQTDENGRFKLKTYIEPDKELNKSYWWRLSYHITADVVSSVGETQSAQTWLHIGSVPLTLDIDKHNINRQLVKEDKLPFTFKVNNLSGMPFETMVTYKVYKLSTLKDAAFSSEDKQVVGDMVLQGTTTSNIAFAAEELYTLPSGSYRLSATASVPEYKGEAEDYYDFVLFSLNDKQIPVQDVDWFYQRDKKFAPGKPASIQFGTNEKDVYVLYDVFTESQRIESRRFMLSDSLITFRYDYCPEYETGIYVSVLFIKNGQFYKHTATIHKERPNKELTLKWESFRNKLRPGEQEEWRLGVSSPDGKPIDAEMLATMYDASLDQIACPNSFSCYISYPSVSAMPWYWRYRTMQYNSIVTHINFNIPWKQVPNWTYDDFYPQLTNVGNFYPGYKTRANMRIQGTGIRAVGIPPAADILNIVEHDVAVEEVAMDTGVAKKSVDFNENGDEDITATTTASAYGEQEQKSEPLPTGMKLRENFNETAFFLPQLHTDSLGQVSIAFTLPESLTRWHLLAIAHTSTMEHGTIEDYITASKEFMVQPNLPRFVRTGDATTIATALINLSGTEIAGIARLELFDPTTERILIAKKQAFSTGAGQTETVTFSFTIKDTSIPLLACRIVADCGSYSDGEQQYLPVLTDKVWMTESITLSVNGEETIRQSLDKLFNNHSNTATERRLTVEFTGNPAWLAVQALPLVATPTSENALSWAVAYYAQTIAAYIIQSQPRIKAVFDSWRTQGVNRETLWSNLQKNPELKTILLEETPWLADATNEADQKERLATLFDLTAIEGKISLCLTKLQEFQNEDGAWCWYKGMYPNRNITTTIVEMMERVNMLTGQPAKAEAKIILNRAISYLDSQLAEEYNTMRRLEKEGNQIRPSEIALQYIYTQAINKRVIPKNMQAIVNYMIAKLPGQLKQFTVYGKAMAAIILHSNNHTEQANAFMKSLLEYTVYTPEIGRYFDTRSAYYSWRNYRIPTQVMAMEALSLMTPQDTLAQEQMKQWLLKQKQSQCWDTPTNTVDAVYALLMRGTNLLTEKQPVQLLLDKHTVTSAEALIPGLDYIKRTYTYSDLKLLPKQITINKPNTGIAWGAIYAQYLEDIDKVSSSKRLSPGSTAMYSQPLTVERRLLLEQIVNGKSVLKPATDTTEWKIGDKIISRLIVKCDRDMDFVQLKDSRAACTEPTDALSGYRYDGNIGYYLSVKDASTSYFFDKLRKGTYTIDNVMRINRLGTYQIGIATIQSAYAPEFIGNTAGKQIIVK